jgi:hypothetical protein
MRRYIPTTMTQFHKFDTWTAAANERQISNTRSLQEVVVPTYFWPLAINEIDIINRAPGYMNNVRFRELRLKREIRSGGKLYVQTGPQSYYVGWRSNNAFWLNISDSKNWNDRIVTMNSYLPLAKKRTHLLCRRRSTRKTVDWSYWHANSESPWRNPFSLVRSLSNELGIPKSTMWHQLKNSLRWKCRPFK